MQDPCHESAASRHALAGPGKGVIPPAPHQVGANRRLPRFTAERLPGARRRRHGPSARARAGTRGRKLLRLFQHGVRPMAFDPRMIDDLARRLAGAVPESVVALRRDLEQNFKGVLQSQLARLDLVTREEFDVQAAVLKRTREKLAALEERLAALEDGGRR